MSFARMFAILLTASTIAPAYAAVQHTLDATLDPTSHTLDVTDTIRLGDDARDNRFRLHANLKIISADVDITAIGDVSRDTNPPTQLYRATLKKPDEAFTLHYAGVIYHPVEQASEEYARSFGESVGTISNEGVFLTLGSFWYPYFDNAQVTFQLTTHLPDKWQSISQGELGATSNQQTTWREQNPQEQIFLIAAPFQVYTQASDRVKAMVYLRNDDAALAQQYLDATAQYIKMYSTLIGPYPYNKFALVENFWETGYGMPSFTLLGSQVIRLPFIIYTSFPHEILHNWWGNGVYADYTSGNWSEGLTAYLADHLGSEQRGQGEQARRQLLQHYADFVGENQDFPLTAFRERHSSVTEAVGYGKTQMVFHMLRRQMGDEKFSKALALFYQQYKFKTASFTDLEHVFSKVSEKDLSVFFKQWVSKPGAPSLAIKSALVTKHGKQYHLALTIEQQQKTDAYALDIPVAVSFADDANAQLLTVAMTGKQSSKTFMFDKEPVLVSVDPEFDVFRRLDRAEIPPALSQAFGDNKALIVLPGKANAALLKAYQQLAASWVDTQEEGIEIITDSKLDALPSDRSVWLLGYENRFLSTVQTGLAQYASQLTSNTVVIDGQQRDITQDSIVLSTRNAANPQHAVVVIATQNAKAVPGLANKLPHYRKYSYLAFSGDAPTNIQKGQWPVVGSPLQFSLVKNASATMLKTGVLPARAPLAALPNEGR